MSKCKVCKKETARASYVYCSNVCQVKFQYQKYINDWKKGHVSGERGVHTKNISRHLKKYIVEKYGEQCILCGWSEKHPVTGNVPLEVDHIDGCAENNTEKNLRLLCPNCHSLTPSFRNLNKSKGRVWRKNKYKKEE